MPGKRDLELTKPGAGLMVKSVKCPHCRREINIGALLGSVSSPAKARAARENAKLGGWPKGRKRGKRKRRSSKK